MYIAVDCTRRRTRIVEIKVENYFRKCVMREVLTGGKVVVLRAWRWMPARCTHTRTCNNNLPVRKRELLAAAEFNLSVEFCGARKLDLWRPFSRKTSSNEIPRWRFETSLPATRYYNYYYYFFFSMWRPIFGLTVVNYSWIFIRVSFFLFTRLDFFCNRYTYYTLQLH